MPHCQGWPTKLISQRTIYERKKYESKETVSLPVRVLIPLLHLVRAPKLVMSLPLYSAPNKESRLTNS